MVEPRLSRMSLAYSGQARLDRVQAHGQAPAPARSALASSVAAALVPVARAQLVGLQRVEHPQHLGDVAADRTGGHHDELDLVVRVHDEGGPLRDTVGAEHAAGGGQLTLDVAEHREGQLAQVRVVLAPGVVDELVVDGDAEHLGVAVGELAVEATELGDLGGADEGEVLRPEEHDAPLALVGLVVDRLERLVGVERHAGGEFVLGEVVTDSEHGSSLSVAGQGGRASNWISSRFFRSPVCARGGRCPGVKAITGPAIVPEYGFRLPKPSARWQSTGRDQLRPDH